MNDKLKQKTPQESHLIQQFTKMLGGDEVKGTAFVTQLISTLKNNTRVAAILNESVEEKNAFFSRMITVATCGLSPEPQAGHIAMIPFKNKVQIIIMAGGLCKIARDNAISILSQAVYENDEFDIFPAEPKIHHKIKLNETGSRGGIKGYYAQATDLNYRRVVAVEFMTVLQVEQHAESFKLSKNENNPWNTHFDAMAKKTVIRKVVKNIGADLTAGMNKVDSCEQEDCNVIVDAADVSTIKNAGGDQEISNPDTKFPT